MNYFTIRNRLQASNVKYANKKLLYIALMNTIDGILTYIGVSNNYVFEVNKLMINVVSNFNRLVFIKLLIPTLFISLTAILINKYNYSKMTISRLLINICLGVYIFVLFTHVVWMGMLVYTLLYKL